jgi:thiamine-phosphate pyrophosphorylase
MKLPAIYPILDTGILARHNLAPTAVAAAFLEAGAGILQIRHKEHWTRAFFEDAREIARLCREAGADLIVNDRADFAMLLHAGLHVGQDDLSPRDARKLIGPDAILGFSSHNVRQLTAAGGEPIDYVAFGPVFSTSTKLNPDPVTGVEEVRRCRSLIEKPLVAIGGITLENARDVLRAGADSLAVISGLIPPEPNARALRSRMEEWLRLGSIALN